MKNQKKKKKEENNNQISPHHGVENIILDYQNEQDHESDDAIVISEVYGEESNQVYAGFDDVSELLNFEDSGEKDNEDSEGQDDLEIPEENIEESFKEIDVDSNSL